VGKSISVAARLNVLLRLLLPSAEFLGSRLTKLEQMNYSTFLLNWQIIKPLFKWTWFGYNSN